MVRTDAFNLLVPELGSYIFDLNSIKEKKKNEQKDGSNCFNTWLVYYSRTVVHQEDCIGLVFSLEPNYII